MGNILTTLRNVSANIVQQININNFAGRTVSFLREVVQIINLNNIILRIRNVPINISQVIHINNIVDRLAIYARGIGQVININNVVSTVRNISANIGQQINIGSIISKLRNIPVGISQIINLNNFVDRISGLSINISQIIHLNNIANRVAGFGRSISQIININNIIDRIRDVPRSISQIINLIGNVIGEIEFRRLTVQANDIYKGQQFWVRATFWSSSSVSKDTFTATIQLPAGFSLKSGETYTHSNTYILANQEWDTEWVVIAPNTTGTYTINVTLNLDPVITKSKDVTVNKKPVNPSLTLFGTEYEYAENGTLYAQMLDEDGSPVNAANCNITIYYPNRTLWVNYEELAYLTASNGLYYYNFTTPNITGVYAAIANCSNPTAYSSATFHVVEHRGISPEEIWTYANRNLTDYNQSFIIDNFNTLWEYFNCTNATIQSQGVCDYLIKTYTYTEEIHTWIDDMKDQTDKIPGLRTVVNSIDNSLVQNNISSTWRFLIIVLVVSLLGFGIVIIIYLLARKTIFKREEIEEELPEEPEEEIESYYV